MLVRPLVGVVRGGVVLVGVVLVGVTLGVVALGVGGFGVLFRLILSDLKLDNMNNWTFHTCHLLIVVSTSLA